MATPTTEFHEFTDSESLGRGSVELTYELYQVADGGESRGTYKGRREGEGLVIEAAGNPHALHLPSAADVERFKRFLRERYMDGATSADDWYHLTLATRSG